MTGKDLSSCSSSFAALFPEKKMNCVRQRSRGERWWVEVFMMNERRRGLLQMLFLYVAFFFKLKKKRKKRKKEMEKKIEC